MFKQVSTSLVYCLEVSRMAMCVLMADLELPMLILSSSVALAGWL